MSEIQLKQDGIVADTSFNDVPDALIFAGFMANQAGSVCRVLLDGEEIALIRPHQSHSGDVSYQRIAESVMAKLIETFKEALKRMTDTFTNPFLAMPGDLAEWDHLENNGRTEHHTGTVIDTDTHGVWAKDATGRRWILYLPTHFLDGNNDGLMGPLGHAIADPRFHPGTGNPPVDQRDSHIHDDQPGYTPVPPANPHNEQEES